jgi:hypothetical protein
MWAGGPLLLVVVLMLILMRLVGRLRRIHHLVFQRIATKWGCHSLPLLALLMSIDGIVRYNGIAEELSKGASTVERQMLLKLGG